MAKRFGVVLTFSKGVTEQEAAEALMWLRDVIEIPVGSTVAEMPPGREVCRFEELQRRKFKMTDMVREYDDEDGSPVWYIP